MCVCLSVSVHHMCAVPKEARRGHQIDLKLESQIVVRHSYGCWELNLVSLEGQLVLLTT